jgi:hypothetical protein
MGASAAEIYCLVITTPGRFGAPDTLFPPEEKYASSSSVLCPLRQSLLFGEALEACILLEGPSLAVYLVADSCPGGKTEALPFVRSTTIH